MADDLVLARLTMGDVVLKSFGAIVYDVAVAGEEGRRLQGKEGVEGGEIGRQIGKDG